MMNFSPLRLILAATVCSAWMLPASAQQSHEKLITETDYLLYLPREYEADTAKQWPLVMCLHGAAETKRNSRQGIDIVRKIGYAKYIEEDGRQFPFIVVSPQAEYGWDNIVLYKILTQVMEQHRVDADRIYLAGLSMGGRGTWEFAQEHAHLFAAIAPICAPMTDVDTAYFWSLANMPIWVNHGNADVNVPISHSEYMVRTVGKYNPNIEFTVWEGRDHHIYFDLYKGDELHEWLLQHTRHKHSPVPVDRAVLESYVGKYSNPEYGWITITGVSDDGGLHCDWMPTIYPLSDTVFYFRPDNTQHVEFRKNAGTGIPEAVVRFSRGEMIMHLEQE